MVFWGLGKEQSSLFPLWLEAGTGRPGAKQIPYSVVSQSALTTSTAGSGVVGKSIKNTIALWAPFVSGGVSHSKAVAEFGTESCRFHLRAATWNSGQEGSGSGFRFRPKDGLKADRSGGQVVVPTGFVNELGETTLLFGKGLLGRERRGNPGVERSQSLADWGVGTDSLVKVAGVQCSGLCSSGPHGSQVCSSSITGRRAKAEPSLGKGPPSLLPLALVEVDSTEGAEATPYCKVELDKGILVGLGRGASDAVHNPGMASASSQQTEGDLRVFHFADGIEELASGCHTGSSVGSDEGRLSNGCPQEFKVPEQAAVPCSSAEEAVWEVGNKLGSGEASGSDDLALLKIELQANVAAAPLDMVKGSGYSINVPCQDPVIKIEGGKVKAALELLGQGLQRGCKEQRSQGVALLDSTGGVNDSVPKLKVRGDSIAPCHPTGKLREVGAGGVEHILPRDGVESVGEVQLEQHLVWGVVVFCRPCPDSVDRGFGTAGDRNPNLSWPEVFAGTASHAFHQALPCKAPEHLADGYRPNPTTRLRDGNKAGPCKKGCCSCASLAIAEERNDAVEVIQEGIGASWKARFAQVPDPEARWAWRSGGRKAPERTAHSPSSHVGSWRQGMRLADGGRALWRVERAECRNGLRRLRAEPFRQQSRTRFAVKPFAGKAHRKVATFSRRAGAGVSHSDSPTAIPQGHALAGLPPLQAVHCVGRSGLDVLVPSPGRAIKDSLRKHEKLLPSTGAVGVGSSRQGSRQDACPEWTSSSWDVPKGSGVPRLDGGEGWKIRGNPFTG